jgi:hypothetical protein
LAEGEEDEGEEKEEDEEGEDEEGGAAAAAPKRNSKATELGGMEYSSWGWGAMVAGVADRGMLGHS